MATSSYNQFDNEEGKSRSGPVDEPPPSYSGPPIHLQHQPTYPGAPSTQTYPGAPPTLTYPGAPPTLTYPWAPSNQTFSYQQPQLIILSQPEYVESPKTMKLRQRAAIICGAMEIILGLVSVVVGVVLQDRDDNGGMATHNFLSPFFAVVTGSMSLVAGLKGYKSYWVATLVLAIITSVVCGGCFMFATVMCGIYGNSRGYHYDSAQARNLAIILGVSLIVHLIVVVTSIVQSGYACAKLCRCCRQDTMEGARIAYFAQPTNRVHAGEAHMFRASQYAHQ